MDGQGREGEGQGQMRRGRKYVGEEEENGRGGWMGGYVWEGMMDERKCMGGKDG